MSLPVRPTTTLRALLTEADAMRRQSMLLHRHLRPRTVKIGPGDDREDVVFLLHGFMATAGVFDALERRLRAVGVRHVASFTYHPLRGVESISRELARACEAIPRGARLHLVGHSLGGVIARHYVQEGGGAGRVHQTISLASPFHGTTLVDRLPASLVALAPFADALSPRSLLLARLREGARAFAMVPHTSLVAGADLLVTPPSSAVFPCGSTVTLDDVGHNGMLFDSRVADEVCRRVVAAREGRPRATAD